MVIKAAQGNNSVDVTPDPRDEDGRDHRSVVVAKDAKADSPGIASVLLLTLSKPDEKWLTGKHYLKLVNPDGQKAVWLFDATQSPAPKPQEPPAPEPKEPPAPKPQEPATPPPQESSAAILDALKKKAQTTTPLKLKGTGTSTAQPE